MTLYLIACSATKASEAVPAADLYTGELFQRSRAYVERMGARWAILSALHGVLTPGAMTTPYDCTMRDKSPQQRRAWADLVTDQLNELHFGGDLIFLAGKDYRRPLLEWPRFRHCFPNHTTPMEGLGIGYQKQWLGPVTARAAQLPLF